MLQRMLGSHSAIHTHPEPHIVQPLFYTGYFDRVDAAPYDHINASEATREFVAALPRGEADYVDACRAYLDVLYGRALEGTGKRYFMDKTPANALALPFLEKVYPEARYVVLTRHPLAVFSSYAESFFESDFDEALRYNAVLARYVPAIARFLREARVPRLQVGYEALVKDPESEMRRICEFLGLEFEPGAIDYGSHDHESKSYGDPKVTEHKRPVTASVEKWASFVKEDPKRVAACMRAIEPLDEADLDTWGYPRATLLEPLDRADAAASPAGGKKGKKSKKPKMNKYRLQRKVLMALRKESLARKMASRFRYYADVILRDSL